MNPDEIKTAGRHEGLLAEEVTRFAQVEPGVDVASPTGNAEFLADVAACPAAGHRIEDISRSEVEEQVADQAAPAIARIAAVAIISRLGRMVKACETGNRAGVQRSQRKLRKHWCPLVRHADREERIDVRVMGKR
jgi:hypothetical protein